MHARCVVQVDNRMDFMEVMAFYHVKKTNNISSSLRDSGEERICYSPHTRVQMEQHAKTVPDN